VNGRIVGVDEAGRGALAGPVFVAAVLLDEAFPRDILTDSKLLSAEQRTVVYRQLLASQSVIRVTHCSPATIDKINIFQATMRGMHRLITEFPHADVSFVVDGNHKPRTRKQVQAVVKGDLSVPQVSAASIVAKVLRDAEMVRLDRRFPHYCFAQHKGYPTELHYERLDLHGPSAVHRRSFRLWGSRRPLTRNEFE
jgi:ribonuclease HII